MDDLRAVIGIFIFSICCYLTYDLFINGFSLWVLIAVVLGFLFVHLIWPKNASGDSSWYDVLEWIVDLPYQALALFFRGIGRVVKGGSDDVGIDL